MDNIRISQKIFDGNSRKLELIAKLFPSIIRDGEVDYDALKEELGQFNETGKEKFELTWAGKTNAKKEAMTDIKGKTLKMCFSESDENAENIYIKGDNLEALKLLHQNYYSSVKMIYIDPPYNTGNDFVYKDNYKEDQASIDLAENNIDDIGNRFVKNTDSQNRFHANWLNMMYPRLKLARDLLRDDGAIFISIDDTESGNLKKICDEIFGEKNFVECLVWKKRATPPNDRSIGRIHEFIYVYAKNVEMVNLGLLPRDEKSLSRYSNPDNDPKGDWVASDLSANGKGGRMTLSCVYPIKNPADGKDYYPPEGKYWLFNKEKMDLFLAEGRIGFREGSGAPFLKRYLSEVRQGLTMPTILLDFGFSQNSAAETDGLFEKKGIFEYAKPVSLIKALIRIGAPGKDDIVMDFFSGSGTTAQAVMELNSEDNMSRKFVLIQIQEPCEESTEAYKAGYYTICDVGIDRIRRAGKRVKNNYPSAEVGMKVFEIGDTNIKWNSLLEAGQLKLSQIESTPDLMDFMPNSKDEDIVYELILRQRDVMLNEELESLETIGKRTYLYADSYLVCLEDKIEQTMIERLANLDPVPVKFIFRDSAFGDDIALKDETFRRLKAVIDKNAGDAKVSYTVEFI
ncbi:site-specific DNA-methyltransferase [Butyrivibrio sp. FC2001]|uniref:site-specific DNA-methyltransferase n=1 Tax=Butyrivibrio sp. FC2001 TaxID=1280671 RepID=UPI000418DB54|nr:site-specific DNA-methyltransferase [Butyrivibrio sp. FC2001]